VSALLVSLALALYILLNDSLGQERLKAESTSRNVAEILETSLRGALHEVDVVMLSAQDEIKRQQAGGKIDRDALDAYLTRQQSFLPQIISLRVTDADGNVRYGPGVRQAAPTNLADRSFFTHQRDNVSDSLYFSPPVLARISKQWVLPLSRRISQGDGSFGGVVYANVALDYLAKAFTSVEHGANGTVTLYDDARYVVARHPSEDAQGSFVGRQASSPQLVSAMDKDGVAGTYRAIASLDGIPRTFSYKKLGDYPLYISVGLAEDDYLAPWYQQVEAALLFYGLFAALLTASAALLLRAWRRQEQAVLDLTEAQREGARTMVELRNSVAVQKATAARLELVLKTAAEGIVGMDPQGRITFANPEAAAMLGYVSPEKLLGLTTLEAFNHRLAEGQSCSQGFCAIRQTLVDGEVRRVADESFQGPGGKKLPVEYVMAPLMLDQKIAGGVLVFHDISDRKEMEAELKRSNTELEQFAYAASHDLREPLRMVSSFVTLLEKRYGGTLNEEAHEYIGFARDGAQRMDRMIHHLLDYSRIGRSKEPFKPVDLNKVVQAVIQDLAPAAESQQALIMAAPDLPTVMGDRDDLGRLLQNLLANALKYRLPDRAPRILVSAKTEGNQAVVSVQDNGIGIPAEQFDRIFAIFQRLHAQSQYEGTGIGLALCKKIVERHGGRIWVESEPNQGSTFLFTLPLASD
jgi:PAS domain S-box-containing protein